MMEMLLRKKLFLSSPVLFVLLSLSLVVSVEADLTIWTQTYGGTNDEHAYSVVEASDGGYAIAGHARSFGAGSDDFWLIKTDEFGYMEWNQTYGGPEPDRAYSLVATSDGGYALTGYTQSFGGTAQADCWLVKTDTSGNEEWNQTYGVETTSFAFDLVETSDGGYAIAGGKSGDFWFIKTDASGIMEWNQTYGGMGDEQAHALIATSDGGYALAGETNSYGAGSNDSWSYDFWLIKTDESGDIPESNTWILPSLLLTATLVIIIYKKKLFNQTSKI